MVEVLERGGEFAGESDCSDNLFIAAIMAAGDGYSQRQTGQEGAAQQTIMEKAAAQNLGCVPRFGPALLEEGTQ
jgi:hypothetical protein